MLTTRVVSCDNSSANRAFFDILPPPSRYANQEGGIPFQVATRTALPGSTLNGLLRLTGASWATPRQHGMSCRENITSAVYVGVRFITTRNADKYCLRLTVFLRCMTAARAFLGLRSALLRHTRAAYIRAGDVFHTSPDPVSSGSTLIWL